MERFSRILDCILNADTDFETDLILSQYFLSGDRLGFKPTISFGHGSLRCSSH